MKITNCGSTSLACMRASALLWTAAFVLVAPIAIAVAAYVAVEHWKAVR